MNDLLRDSTGQVWQLSVSDDGSQIGTTSTSGGVAPNSVPVADIASGQAWALSVLPGGQNFQLDEIFGPITTLVIQVTSPNGNIWQIAASNGSLTTIQSALSISPGTVATPSTACPFTLSDMTSALAQRLYDPQEQFWTTAEKTAYIQEALREFNVLTCYSRGDFTFPVTNASQWYDLTAVTGTLRPFTVADTNLYSIIEYHLLEPQTALPLAWIGSTQFSMSDLSAAVQHRRDELLALTTCSLSRIVLTAPPSQSRIQIPNNSLDIRRLAWFPVTGSPVVLRQTDKFSQQSYRPSFTTLPAKVPKTYTMSTEPFLQLDVNPPPALPGSWEILYSHAGAALSSSATTATTMGIPDDWCWVLKWGALADLLSRESNAKDDLRAKYCEQRYSEGVSLLTNAPALLAARINNQPIRIDAVRGADTYKSNWQGVTGKPKTALTAGLNMVAFAARPDASYSITTTVVQNFPIPVAAGDCIEVTPDIFDAILMEAQHLAMFKCGGAEFVASIELHKKFLTIAAEYASKLGQMGEYQAMIQNLSQREESMNPRLEPEEVDA